MPAISNPPVQSGDQYVIRHDNTATTTATDYTFANTQDTVTVFNLGSRNLVATANGVRQVIEPNDSESFKNASILTIQSVLQPVSFRLEGRTKSGTTGSAGVDNVARNMAESAAQGLANKLDAATYQTDKTTMEGQITTLDEKLEGVAVNVKTFNALGNGTNDDTAAIQAAINAVKPTGGKVFFPVGRYKVTSPLSLPSYVTLDGFGEKSEIFTLTDNINLIVSEVNAEKCTVKNLKIVGSGKGTQPLNTIGNPNVDNAGSGIIFRGVKKGLIESCILDNHGGLTGSLPYNGVAAIWLTYGCRECIITKNRVTNSRNGINEDNFYGLDPFNILVTDNYVEKCRFGIVSDNSDKGKGMKILNNTIKKCRYSAIDINKSSYVTVRGNWIEQNGDTQARTYVDWQPQTAYSVGDIVHANGKQYQSTVAGTSGTAPPNHHTSTAVDGGVTWNYLTGTYATAVNIYGSATFRVFNTIVENNTIIDNFGTGVKVVQNAQRCKVQNNDIINSGGQGIQIQACRYYLIQGNTIENAKSSGIHGMPIDVGGAEMSIDQGIIQGNSIGGCKQHGIYLEKALTCNIANNKITNNSNEAWNIYSGISLNVGTTGTIVNGNTISGSNHKYGLTGSDANTKNNIISNNISTANNIDYAFAATAQYFSNNVSSAGAYTP